MRRPQDMIVIPIRPQGKIISRGLSITFSLRVKNSWKWKVHFMCLHILMYSYNHQFFEIFIFWTNCKLNKYMNRYLTKRHNYNRINYYRLALYILAPKVLLISSFFFSGRRNLRLDPHRVIFSPYCFSIVLFFRQFYNPNYVVYMVV